MQKKTIKQLVLDYFQARPKQPLPHAPVVDWVTEQRVAMGYDPPRDVWRMIRQLHANGILKQHEGKGIYEYDPDYEHETDLKDFPESMKQEIFKRDNYRCVVCNLGKEDGVTIDADHKKPKSKGGENTVENGQTLCRQHNLMKKNYSQTEAGKRFFKHTYEMAVQNQDEKMIAFCEAVFEVYKEHDMNGHIESPDRKTRHNNLSES